MKLPLERIITISDTCEVRVFDGMEHRNGTIELSDATTIRKTYIDQHDHRMLMALERACLTTELDVFGECEVALLNEFTSRRI